MYHYNHYEPTSIDHLTELHGTRQEAVGALMGRFATREDEVDDLFRLGVFVDLYRVVRQGVRAGVESYSIKRLEPMCGYDRRVDLGEATASLIALEAALEDGTAARDSQRQRVVAGYNEDDCRATLALRDWLEDRRAELAERLGEELPRPVFAEKPGSAEDPETARIRSALLAGVSAEASGAIAWGVSAETSEVQARALLADLLDWHRREDKPAWWRNFYVRTLSPAELIGEPAPRRDRCGPRGKRPVPPRSGSRCRCAAPTCPCRGRRGPGRPTLRPSRSSSSSRGAARSASPGHRMRSSTTSSTPCTSTRGGTEPGRPGSASGRIATTRTGMQTPR